MTTLRKRHEAESLGYLYMCCNCCPGRVTGAGRVHKRSCCCPLSGPRRKNCLGHEGFRNVVIPGYGIDQGCRCAWIVIKTKNTEIQSRVRFTCEYIPSGYIPESISPLGGGSFVRDEHQIVIPRAHVQRERFRSAAGNISRSFLAGGKVIRN